MYLEESATLDYQHGDRIIGALYMTGHDITFSCRNPGKNLPFRLVLPDNQVMQIGVVPNQVC